MADQQNTARHILFREAVAQTLAMRGHPDAKPAPRRRITVENWDQPQGHIEGLADAEIYVQSSINARPYDGLAEAEAAAKAAGKPFGVFVMARPQKPTSEAYAVLSLASLALLLADREADR